MESAEALVCLLVGATVVIAAAVLVGGLRLDARCPLHLLREDNGNEALIVEGFVAGECVLFLLDTAYAGAPVLSLCYLHCLRAHPHLARRTARPREVRARFSRTARALRQFEGSSDAEMYEALNGFVARGVCRSFTSGCTMRLMSIGETSESQSEMLLCPPLAVAPRRAPLHWDADVLVTHPLRGSPHILTVDYLLHHGPAVLEIARGRLQLHAPSLRRRHFDLFDATYVGGAFVVPVLIDGQAFDMVVDTGASTTAAIARSAAARIAGLEMRNGKTYQHGINGEVVCSDVAVADLTLGSARLGRVGILVNSQDVEGADGYLGIGVLRAFDIYMDHRAIGFRANGLRTTELRLVSDGSCERPERAS